MEKHDKMKPLVSVVMCVYNRKNLLAETLKSILNQTFENFELIIIDDGSEEELEEFINSFQDPRIRYKKLPENKGVPTARNIGNSMAKGEFIAVMDSDDINFPQRLQVEVDTLLQNPRVDVVYSSVIINYPNDSVKVKHFEAPEFNLFDMIYKENQCFHPTVMFRKECLDKANYREKYRYGSDYVFLSELAIKCCRFKVIKEPLIRYVRHNKSISRENKKEQTDMSRKGIKEVIAEQPEQIRKAFDIAQELRGVNKFDYAVSVIIPTYNNLEELKRTLDGLRHQTYDNFEVIVADDGSSEDVLSYVKSCDPLNYQYYWNPDKGYTLCNVRNAGLKLAYGKVIVFLDADMIPEHEFIEKVINLHNANGNLLAIHGRNQVDKDGEITDLEDRELNINEPWRMMGGGNVSILRANAETIGLFDSNYNLDWGLEDADWAKRAMRIGISVIYAGHILALHQGTKTYKDFGKNKWYFRNKWKDI